MPRNMQIFTKAFASADVLAGTSVSSALLTSPVWLAALTDWFQLVALLIGIFVGYSTYKVNLARAAKIKDELNE